ncbi:MAG: DUF4282 domain-containing protein [Egibacteraceae bacterium]
MEKGFLTALFDFSFRSFVTARIVSVLYILATIVLGIYALVIVGFSLTSGGPRALIGLVLAPLFFLLGMMYVRVLLEALVVLHRIEGNTARIASVGPAPGTDAGPASSE